MIPKNYITRTMNRHYKELNTTVDFKTFSKALSSAPNIYGERIGTKGFNPPITVSGYLEIGSKEARPREAGWEKADKEITFRTPFSILVEKGLTDTLLGKVLLTKDDRMEYDGKEYQLYEINLREPFLDGKPTLVWITGRLITNERTT